MEGYKWGPPLIGYRDIWGGVEGKDGDPPLNYRGMGWGGNKWGPPHSIIGGWGGEISGGPPLIGYGGGLSGDPPSLIGYRDIWGGGRQIWGPPPAIGYEDMGGGRERWGPPP